jgi:acyl dehydratase
VTGSGVARRVVPPTELAALVGRESFVSDWVLVDQARIDAFAAVTEDHQFIHVDPAAAALTPFGGTIAHGFLTLSLLAPMAMGAAVGVEGATLGVNYGFDKLRFLQPVKSGSRIRGRFTLADAREKGGAGRWLLAFDVSVEIEGESKPALAARWLNMQLVPS